MGLVRVQSLKNQALIADKCHVADSFFDRLRGLIGRTGLAPGEGMFFPRCNDIHMWFMRFPIDVVFLSPGTNERELYRVSSVHRGVRPWRPRPLIDWKASDTLELPAGTIERFAIETGDELCIN